MNADNTTAPFIRSSMTALRDQTADLIDQFNRAEINPELVQKIGTLFNSFVSVISAYKDQVGEGLNGLHAEASERIKIYNNLKSDYTLLQGLYEKSQSGLCTKEGEMLGLLQENAALKSSLPQTGGQGINKEDVRCLIDRLNTQVREMTAKYTQSSKDYRNLQDLYNRCQRGLQQSGREIVELKREVEMLRASLPQK